MRQKINCKTQFSRLVIALSIVLGIGSFSMRAFALPRVEISQPNKVIKGHIVDENGEALPGASIVIKGQTSGVISDINGNFSLSVTNGNAVIVVSSVGYKTQEIALSGRTTVNISMSTTVSELKEVVVTALGIKREKKSLGYAVQDVKADELTKTGTSSLADALQGKVAGLNINDTGTGAGGSAKIVIRGNSSLSDNNEPLWVVDGVPFDSAPETANMQWGGYDRAGGSFDLNPEDIESISVLKGPTAAALYGSRAGNGVILVTTKKGGKNGKFGITYSGKFTWSPIAYTLDEQDTYGQGSGGVFNPESLGSWGPKMQSQSVAAWWDNSKTTSFNLQKDVMKNFFRTGSTQSNNVTIGGGDRDNPFRLSFGHDYIKGNMERNVVAKTTFDLVTRYTMNKYVTFDVKANYINVVGECRPELGYYSTMYYLYTMPRNVQLSDLYTYRYNLDELAAGEHVQGNWITPNADHQNPYFILDDWNNKDKKNRFFGMFQATIHFTPELTLKLKQGLDYSSNEYDYTYKYADGIFGGRPLSEMTKSSSNELNSEFLLSYNKTFGDFQLGLSAGGNRMYRRYDSLYGQGALIPFPNTYYLAAGSKQYTSNDIQEKQINSLYAFANLGYKDFLYMDLTARNDWSSTLPSNNRSYFYPSVAISSILTSAMDAMNIGYNKNLINYGKIRFSIAQVGKDTDPYQLVNTYGTTTDDAHGILYTTEPTSLANMKLKPEISTSWEVGTEWRFFKNRLGLDFTYYDMETKNQVLSVPDIFSTGYSSQIINVGKITNKGIELAMNGSVIKNKGFNLDLNLNLAHNVTKVKELDPLIDKYTIGSLNNDVSVVAIAGDKLGEIWGQGYLRDNNGNIIVDSNGLPQKGDKKVLGSIQPDFTGSFGINVGYKGFALSALFSFQKGGDIYSYTEDRASYYGNAKCTANRDGVVFNGVTSSGAKNTTSVDAETYWTQGTNPETFVYNASFLKLKELSLSYTFNKNQLSLLTHDIINSLKFSLFGSNLLYLVKHTPGTTPDGSAFSSNMFSQAIDFSPIPNTRNYGFSINVGF